MTHVSLFRVFAGQQQKAMASFYDYVARCYPRPCLWAGLGAGNPALGKFLQADTLVPDPANPQSLNRYAYVLNHPLRYTDPSGHIAQDEQDAADSYLNQLLAYDVNVKVDWGWAGPSWARRWETGLWTLAELDIVLQGVQQLAEAMGGKDAFRSNLGGVTVDQKAMRHGGLGKAHRITLNADGFTYWTVVHELAHAWDGAHSWRLSKEMQKAMGAGFSHPVRRLLAPNNPTNWYDPGQGPPPCGVDANFNHREDFAEAVTAYVYPQMAAYRATASGWPYGDASRGYNYPDFGSTPRGQHIQALMVTPP